MVRRRTSRNACLTPNGNWSAALTDLVDNNERWKPVVGNPHYEVSTLGRVKRVLPDLYGRISDKPLKGTVRPDGYVSFTLHDRGRQASRLGHHLVCEAFLGPRPSHSHHACHNDGVKTNNALNNLRWATPVENNADKLRHGTVLCGDKHPARLNPGYLPLGEAHKMAKLTDGAVREIRSDNRKQSEIAKDHGVSQTLISQVKRRLIWRHIS